MKRFLCSIMLCVMACLVCSAQSYKEVFAEGRKTLSFGLHFGAIGQAQDLGLQIIVGSVTFYNVYVDFGGWPQAHGSDVRIDKWDEDRAYLFHTAQTGESPTVASTTSSMRTRRSRASIMVAR